MLAYAVGRIGCQVAGDGDWGIYNSAYITDSSNKAVAASSTDFKNQLSKYQTYFLNGDRKSDGLEKVPNHPFVAPSWMPIWLVAYNYPQNVNKDGITMSNTTDEHNKVLPVPVYPTPFYETVMCTILFLFLWSIRKRIKTAGVMTGIYFILNGLERFTIEKIRVNNKIDFLGMSLSQAEIISFGLILSGILIIVMVKYLKNKED
jgi:phosphatidylglycerol:prolipoprotein diacylglycerol transferase